jgi:hypothetical protein
MNEREMTTRSTDVTDLGMRVPLLSLFILATLGCQDKAAGAGSPTAMSATAATSATATPITSGPTSTVSGDAASATGEGAIAGDATGTLLLAWKITNAVKPRVSVSIVAGEQSILVGDLDATSDDAPDGTVEACSMRNKGKESTLTCGGTPAYNFYTAKIEGGALVVSLTTGVDNDPPGSEKVKQVLRRPTTATALKATGPASQALYGNCRAGYVQRKADTPCLHKCIKGTECKGTDACKLIDITGTDGPHKVSACVPAGSK